MNEQGLLKISGADARRFLQSQTTNDTAVLEKGGTLPSASVDRQGKIQGVYTVYFDGAAYWLLIDKAQIEPLVAHLSKFKILDDVTFEDVSNQLDAMREHFPVLPADDVARVEAGMPKFSVDYDFETMLPETGLQQTYVSYDKGCYLGQEVIARVKTYGMLQKALAGLVFENLETPPPAGELLVDNKSIGKLTSAVYSPAFKTVLGLAYLDKTHRVPGQQLKLTLNVSDYTATVSLLPFEKKNEGAVMREKALRMFSQGEETKAIALLREAVASNGNDPDTYEALGAILGRNDATLDEAMALMEKVLAIDPDHVMAHTNLSIYWLKKGDKDKAEEEKAKATIAAFRKKAKEAGLAMPDPEEERRKKEKQMLERIAMFTEALSHAPDDPLGNFGLGSAYLELDRFAEAVAPFEKTIAAQPKHTVAYLSLGKALSGSGEQARAKDVFIKGIEVAAARGDMMPLQEMQRLLAAL